ncbi:MAG: hypothetical protein DPW09_38380 [Anaerolineae bacterium]|nr:hypothetical protein [Anaerolineae bacterium]
MDKLLSGETGPPLDLLVIHVDAGIAIEHDLQDEDETPIPDIQQPCPPIQLTANQLKHVIERWLQQDILPPQVILAIPAQDTENWTFAALFPDDELCSRNDYECTKNDRDHPGYRLTLKKYGKVLQRNGRTIKKPRRNYEQIVPQLVTGWDSVCHICSQAQQFTQDVLGRL